MYYNKELRDISNRLYSSNGNLRNTVDYMAALPTLDFVITSLSEGNVARYRKKALRHILRKLRHKELIRDALLKGCIDGTAFYYLSVNRPESAKTDISLFDAESISEINAATSEIMRMRFSAISLPVDYCRIIGRLNNSYVVAFDLAYFVDSTESSESKLKKYPAEFAEAFRNWQQGKTEQMMILDNSKTIVHKISSKLDEPWGRPLVLPAILDILYADYFTNTKRRTLDDINNRLVYQTFPEGKVQGTSSLSDEQQERQHIAVRDAVTHKNSIGGISFVSVAAGTKIDTIDTDTDIFNNNYEQNLDDKIGTDLGFAAALLNASATSSFSAQQTNLELVTAQIFEWVNAIAEEINKVISQTVFGVDFADVIVNYLPISHLNKSAMVGYAKDLYLQGKGSLGLWASAAGIPTEVFFALLDEELEANIEEKYPVHRTSYTQSSDNDVGRPTVDNPTNENTIQSKTNNSNGTPRPM